MAPKGAPRKKTHPATPTKFPVSWKVVVGSATLILAVALVAGVLLGEKDGSNTEAALRKAKAATDAGSSEDAEFRDTTHDIVKSGDVLKLEKWLEEHPKGLEVRSKEANATPLMVAAQLGFDQMVEFLIQKGADVNAIEHQVGLTVLRLAASRNHANIVRTVIGAGAKVNLKDAQGYSPLMVAAIGGHTESVDVLLEYNANPTYKDKLIKKTAAEFAEMRNFDELAEKLKAYERTWKK